VKLGLSLPLNAEIRELREQLASDTGISEQYMLLTEIDDLGFLRTFAGKQDTFNIKLKFHVK
jgi:ubiquitin carboxyl-terminal hydrolase 31